MSNEDWKSKPESYWKEKLTPEQYKVARKAGTEKPFKNAYHDERSPGTYRCVCCNTELFSSEHKFDSGTGWPSFFDGQLENIELKQDYKLFRKRTEVLCKNCGAHLGHVFEDGPQPSGKRSGVNSAAMNLEQK